MMKLETRRNDERQEEEEVPEEPVRFPDAGSGNGKGIFLI